MSKGRIAYNAAISVIAAGALALSVFLYFTQPRIAYVHNNRLLTEYQGVKEGKRMYEEKASNLKSNLDTLEKEINIRIKEYQAKYESLSPEERAATENVLKKKQQEYFTYKSAIDEQVKEEDTKLSAAVLNQIDSYIIEFAKENKYDYIFGVGSGGNLFFAKEGADVTDEVLEGLNKKYRGE